MSDLTAPQRRALEVLAEQGQDDDGRRRTIAPRAVAKAMWPDSPGWERRTNKRGGVNGAVGGTMPMKAATVLWRLHGKGYASLDPFSHNAWSITDEGLRALEEKA